MQWDSISTIFPSQYSSTFIFQNLLSIILSILSSQPFSVITLVSLFRMEATETRPEVVQEQLPPPLPDEQQLQPLMCKVNK